MKYLTKRTLAYLIDCKLAYLVVMLIVQWAILSHLRELWGLTDSWFAYSWNTQIYVLMTISIPVWIYFTYFESTQSKGIFGKRILKLA